MEPASTADPVAPDTSTRHAQRFFVNVLWNWTGVAANLVIGLFLSPYIIRKLGDERYGIWALAFALMEYFFLFDLGFRSAVVNYTSRFRAQGDTDKINEVINTALCYFLGVALAILTLTILFSGKIYHFFAISEVHRLEFSTLVMLVGFSWAGGMVCNIFQAALEAFQRFKVYNHIWVITLTMRAIGCTIVLYLGYGLVRLGVVVVCCQATGYLLTFLAFGRAFPELRFSRSLIRAARLKEMAAYGIPSFVANSSGLFLNQGPPVLVGHFLPEAFIGYFALPSRLMQYAVDAIARIGFITAPNTAEMVALGRVSYVAKLGMYLNRYCLAVFLPMSMFLIIYGRPLILTWIGPRFAEFCVPLLPAVVLSTSFAQAGQFNSSSILFGMARHRMYACAMLVEAGLLIGALMVVIPRYGIVGAAWAGSVLMMLNRGLLTPWMVCRNLDFSFARYMRSIYVRPVLCAVPVLALAWYARNSWLPGRNWSQLIAAAAMISSLYYIICFVACLEGDHRTILRDWAALPLKRFGFNG